MWKVSEEPEGRRKHGDELQADTSASLKAETHKSFWQGALGPGAQHCVRLKVGSPVLGCPPWDLGGCCSLSLSLWFTMWSILFWMLDTFAGVEIANERWGPWGEEGELWWGEGLAEAGWSDGNGGRSLGGDAVARSLSVEQSLWWAKQEGSIEQKFLKREVLDPPGINKLIKGQESQFLNQLKQMNTIGTEFQSPLTIMSDDLTKEARWEFSQGSQQC